MIPAGEPLPPGYCQHCREECRDRLGADVYPDRPELADLTIWECVFCGARVGSHEEGAQKGKALGTAANPELRKARAHCHKLIDPIWQSAHLDYPEARNQSQAERIKALAIIKRTARKRVYEFMASGLGIPFDRCHIAMMDLEQCRALWRLMRDVKYQQVRDWAHQKKKAG